MKDNTKTFFLITGIKVLYYAILTLAVFMAALAIVAEVLEAVTEVTKELYVDGRKVWKTCRQYCLETWSTISAYMHQAWQFRTELVEAETVIE